MPISRNEKCKYCDNIIGPKGNITNQCCKLHYYKLKKHGDPYYAKPKIVRPKCEKVVKPRYKDYINQTINGFYFIRNTMNKNKSGNYIWTIRCHCGNIFDSFTTYITKGKQKNCCKCYTLHRRNKHPDVDSLRQTIRRLLKTKSPKKNNMAFEILGCSRDFFKQYLEKQFTNGMTWENYGHFGWHLDHIKPCIAFDLTNIEQQKECFHYTNYQPLWWQDNLKKGAKWTPAQLQTA